MMTVKCRCATCQQLVTQWIDDKCVKCYNGQFYKAGERAATILCVRGMAKLRQEHTAEMSRFREVDSENNRFWSSLVNSYRDRLEVRMVDKATAYFGRAAYAFWSFVGLFRLFTFVSFFRLLTGVAGLRNLLPWPKK